MEIVNHRQGSTEWHQYRATKFNASDAPSMLDVSKYKSRNELLRERATGVIAEVSAATQRIFNDGHRFEALARTRAEALIGEELFPVVGFYGDLSASFDGLTMSEDVAFEHKTLNDEIRSCQSVDDLHPQYKIQMEQQLLVSGAEKCLFLATKWSNNDILLEEKHFWYEPNLELRNQIIAGWDQFKKDLETYVFVEVVEPPKAEALKDLPAVTIQVKGELTLSNLGDVAPLFDKFLAEAKTTLVTDDDFAIAEAEAKLGRETAKRCKLTAKAVVDQISSVSEAVKTLGLYAEKFDKLALSQEKAVKEQKETRKAAAKLERDGAYVAFIADLEKGIVPIRLQLSQDDKPDFVSAMKGQRTLTSLYSKLDAELARAKIAASTMSNDIRTKLDWCKESSAGYGFLFNDLQQIIYKSEDDFKLLVTTRIDQRKAQEAERLEQERQRIAAEEKAKAERELAEKLKADVASAVQKLEQEAKPIEQPAEPAQQPIKLVPVADKPVGEVAKQVAETLQKTPKVMPNRDALILVVADSMQVDKITAEAWLLAAFNGETAESLHKQAVDYHDRAAHADRNADYKSEMSTANKYYALAKALKDD